MQSNRNDSCQNDREFSPIAIVGIGCRLPGGIENWRDYWHLLSHGIDAIEETPKSRWSLQKFYCSKSGQPGKTHSKWGGYVRDIELFDPQLFGISPREAASMDPQQRMLLESAWRAIEDAGQPIKSLAGQPVAVFVGISSFDYAVAGLSSDDRGVIDPYSNTGGSSSIAANRISYCFDLRGPSVAVDSACSSSLVAVHLACESMWNGNCKFALAGGVNALLLPDFYVAFSQLGVLSPDGRCKTFDSRANGYVRSEGAGMVLLKPLADAERDRDTIYAVIRATELNQDGRTPGMTVPSQAAQEALVRAACAKARIRPAEIQYVEAHGTGTPVGDPIEASALAAVLQENRPANQACWIGSVKTNIGHLEAGAGIASLIKVALSLHHQQIPAHLHFQKANPAIDFEHLQLKVPTQSQPWLAIPGQTRLAGINGFGYGGANAHVILEEAPRSVENNLAVGPKNSPQAAANKLASPAANVTKKERQADAIQVPVVLPLSAQTAEGLSSLARRWHDWFEQLPETITIAEAASFAAHRRSHLDYRATVRGSDTEELLEQLRLLADNAQTCTAALHSPSIAFICSGQGPQWWGMGRQLMQFCPPYRQIIESCDLEFKKLGATWSLVEELSRDEATSRMQRTSIAQPSLFALQIALAHVWRGWGVSPAVVIGHSVGEIAAAYITGALSFEDACCVAYHRGRTMDLATSQGAMIAVGLSVEEVQRWIADHRQHVSIAAINGPTSLTISGAANSISQIADKLEAANIFCRRLKVEYAFHSPQMEPVRSALFESLAHIEPRATKIQLVSTVTGQPIDGQQLDANYWWQNVRQSVRFADAMQAISSTTDIALEIGPHPVLAYSISECSQAAEIHVLPSLHREFDDLRSLCNSLGALYSLGVDIQWKGFYALPTRKILIPEYPFQRMRLWNESRQTRLARLNDASHPLLGQSQQGPAPHWQARIDLRSQSYLADHCVRGVCVYPAAAIIETALAAAKQVGQSETVQLERFQLLNPCMLVEGKPQWIETHYCQERQQFELAMREVDGEEWNRLACVKVSSVLPTPASSQPEQWEESFDANRLYNYCQRLGLEYGERFRGVKSGTRRVGAAVVEVELQIDELEANEYAIHPALLDSCFHAMIAADADFDHRLGGLYLPAQVQRIRLWKTCGSRVTAQVRLVSKTAQRLVANIDVYDAAGLLCLSIEGFESQRVVGGTEKVTQVEDLVYGYRWVLQPISHESVDTGRQSLQSPKHWLIFADDQELGQSLASRLEGRGDSISLAFVGNEFRQLSAFTYSVNPESKQDFVELLHKCNQTSTITNVVYLWGLNTPHNEQLQACLLDRSTLLTALAPLYLVQAWQSERENHSAKLAVVTINAQNCDDSNSTGTDDPIAVAQTPLIGFGRVIVSEYSAFETKLVDISNASATEELLAELLSANDSEDEIMWRGSQRWAHRFIPNANLPIPVSAAKNLPNRLEVGASSGVEELAYHTCALPQLGANEIEIEVVATGLNFSDVMKALDLYPGMPDGPAVLGAECSGRITRVGSQVNDWRVGDEVVAVAPGSFASHVIVSRDLVARKPSNLSHQQAAAIPIAFLTADYALNECARVRNGESILIHAASGGVGLAAIQLAKLAGCRVFATAGNAEKRAFVRNLGAELVMDSRSLNFADEIHAHTANEKQPGVDAVLNSLPGEAIRKGISVLKTGGRFLEIGKRDIYADAALGLYEFRNNLAFFAIDLDQLLKQQPARLGQQLRELMAKFEGGQLQPVLTKDFPVGDTRAAFRFMQQGKHIGKVVVGRRDSEISVQPGSYDPIRFRSNATYWIAGGLGGFGLEVASWLASHGAGCLVLSGRSARPSAAAVARIAQMQQNGTQVLSLPTDIADEESVRNTLAIIEQQLAPLAGVFHTAMVLEDRMLVDLDRATLERVLRPKVLGGWNLHQATLGRELDHFVLFSSLSSVFGHAGQANYSAANALLDGLAHYRRANGLPALVMNWGHLGEVGYLAEREQLGQRLERQGVLSFTVAQALACLEFAMQLQQIQLSVLRMDWTLWRGLGITSRVSPRFAHLLQHSDQPVADSQTTTVTAQQLRSADEATRQRLVDVQLRTKAGTLLGIAPEQIRRERGLLEMGLDSLMAVEMRNWIEAHLEVSLPISILMRSGSLRELTETLCKLIAESSPSQPASESKADQNMLAANQTKDTPNSLNTNLLSTTHLTGKNAAELLEQLPALADAEVSQLLSQLLREQDN